MIIIGARRGVVTGTDLRTHLLIDGAVACGAVDGVATLSTTTDPAVVTCAACLAGSHNLHSGDDVQRVA